MTEKRKPHRAKKRDANFLPSHIGKSFLDELTCLVAGMAQTGGFREQYLESEFLTKYCDPKTTPPDVRRSNAIKKWQSVEKRNFETNSRIALGDMDFGWVTSDKLIKDARIIIAEVLQPLDVDAVFFRPTHTNGASTRIPRGPKALIDKHGGKAHVSSMAIKHWLTVASETRLISQDLELMESSELFTVPKSTDIDRVACKEPEVNMLLQRCIGGYIRHRLREKGINLNDQSLNQDLARDALSLGLATIDLSSASDTITRSLVMALLPTEWWVMLDDIRVHYANVDGEIHYLQMFSSMGNGFTFELESLIFWALTRSICKNSGVKGKISVYGDDIIAPSSIGARLKRTFAWFGFTVNAKKSFWSGPFRESCGKHYHNSLEVTPFYVRKPISEKTEMIRLLNRLYTWDTHKHFKVFMTQSVAEFHQKWSKQIPQSLWGGTNPEDITSLVTGHPPRKRLRQSSLDISFSHELGMSAWFLIANSRVGLEWDLNLYLLPSDPIDIVEDIDWFDDTGLELVPSIKTKFAIADQVPYLDKHSGVFDAGEVTTWNPYELYGSPVVRHTLSGDGS